MERARAALARLGTDAGALDAVFKAACLDIADTVGATRASIWIFSADGSELECEREFDRRTGGFACGHKLRAADVPDYFRAIRTERRVRAVDARAHPATACLWQDYFSVLGVSSLLDHIIHAGTEPVAVLCCEACDAPHDWTDADAAYLEQMAILLGIAIDQRRNGAGAG